jgi:hypothetical protein
MTLGEILEHWITINELNDGFEIYVADPKWVGPHEIETEWVRVLKVEFMEPKLEGLTFISKFISSKKDFGRSPYGLEKYGITDPNISAGVEKVLDRKTFFKTCDDCGVRNHTFHMEGRICRSCIPEIPGMVY